MAEIPDDVKALADEAAQPILANMAEAATLDVAPVDGFAEEGSSSRESLVVEGPAADVPDAYDTAALTAARDEKTAAAMEANADRYEQQQSAWDEQLNSMPEPAPEPVQEPVSDIPEDAKRQAAEVTTKDVWDQFTNMADNSVADQTKEPDHGIER